MFLLAALAISCTLWLPQVVKVYAIVPTIAILLVASNIYNFSKNCSQTILGACSKTIKNVDTPNLPTLLVTEAIKRYTPEDSVIVVYGNDWSSDIAYYAQRKSFTVPNWFKDYSLAWSNPSNYLGGKKLAAIAFYGMTSEQITQRDDVKQNPRLLKIDNWHIWFPNMPLNALDKIMPSLPQYAAPKFINCGANQAIDSINNSVNGVLSNTTAIGLLSVRGWLAASISEGVLADASFVTMTDTKGVTQYLTTHSIPRRDINKAYRQPTLADIGFNSTVDVTGLNGNYTLGLARAYRGQLERCTEYNIPVTIW